MNSQIQEGNKFISHSLNFNNKLNCDYFIDIRLENSYYVIGDIYNHSIEGKFFKQAKLIDITPKYLDVLFNKESYLCYGMDRLEAIEYIKNRFAKTSTLTKVNFKKQRIAILVFETVYHNFKPKQLNLL